MEWMAKLFTFFIMEGTTISELMINEQIRDKEVRLIGENGEQLGVMSAREAQKLAEEAGLDLVKIAVDSIPDGTLCGGCFGGTAYCGHHLYGI